MRIYGKYRRDIHKYNQCISIFTFVQITFSLKYLCICAHVALGRAYSSCHLKIMQNVVNFWKCIFVPLRVCRTTNARCLKFIIYASAASKCSNILPILYFYKLKLSSHAWVESRYNEMVCFHYCNDVGFQ